MSEFLTPAEVRELTQRAHRESQAQALESMGVPFRRVGRSIIVSRHHTREWLAGRSVTPSRPPDMNAIR